MEDIKHISIVATYSMYDVTDGRHDILEAVNEDRPLRFMTEFGMMPIKPLEKVLAETASGQQFSLTLSPEEGFGEYVAERVIDLDKQIFTINGVFDDKSIYPGTIVPLQNEQGERFLAQVSAITDDKVRVDLNHPLAGKTLLFEGKVIDAHEASEEEVMALLNQMNQHHGCGGCGGGGCSGKCGEGGCGNCGEGGCGNCGNEGCGN